MTNPQPTPLPGEIADQLVELERRVRTIALVRGLGTAAITATAAAAAALLFDYFYALAGTMRIGLLALVSAVPAAILWRSLVNALAGTIHPVDLAAVVEHGSPDLQERLTSLVQLHQPRPHQPASGSKLMIDLLTRQTLRSVGPLDFTSAVSPSRALRRLYWGAAGVLLLALPFVVAPAAYQLLWSRLLVPWGNFDTAGNLYFEVAGGSRTVPRGSDLTITARAHWRQQPGRRPAVVWFNRTDSAGTGDRRPMDYDEQKDLYVARTRRVSQSFRFSVSAGRAHSQSYQINVVDRPRIVGVVLGVTPPPYTGFPAVAHDGAVGSIPVFERSRLAFQLEFNKPVTTGELVWSAGAGGDYREIGDATSLPRHALPLALAPDGKSATLEWTAERGGPYAFRLIDRHGLPNTNEPARSIEITHDQPPRLFVTADHPDSVRFGRTVRVHAKADDDVAIGLIELHYEIPGDPSKGGVLTATDSVPTGGREVSAAFELDPGALQLAAGARLAYRIRAADTRPEPGPNEVWSPMRHFVVQPDAADSAVAEAAWKRDELRRTLSEIRESVESARNTAVEHQSLAEQASFGAAEFQPARSLPPLADEILRQSQRLEALAGRFASHPIYILLAPDSQQIARQELSPASSKVRQSVAAGLPEAADTLAQTSDQLTTAGERLADLEQQFDHLAEIESDLLELNRLAELTQQLADQAAALEQRLRDVPSSETEQQRAERENRLLAEQQLLDEQRQQLADQLEELFQRRPELVDAARQSQLDQLLAVAKELDRLAGQQELVQQSIGSLAEEHPAAPAAAGGIEEAKPSQGVPGNTDPDKNVESATDSNPETPAPVNAEHPDAFAARLAQARQRMLALQSAQLVLDAARTAGPDSPVLSGVARIAGQTDMADRQATAGRFDAAQSASRAASDLARQLEQRLKREQQADPGSADVLRRLDEIAQAQNGLSEEFGRLSGSEQARSAAQQAGERRLAERTETLSRELSEISDNLQAKPIAKQRVAKQAATAGRVTRNASRLMHAACNCLLGGQTGDAAKLAAHAARSLRYASQAASDAAESAGAQLASPVPAPVADDVVQAARSLEEARRQLQQAAEQAAPSSAAGSEQAAAAQPNPSGASSPPDSSQPSQAGQSSAANNSPNATGSPRQAGVPVESLQQAAQSLKQAAQKLQSAGPGNKADASSLQSGQTAHASTSNELPEGGSGSGSQAPFPVDEWESALEKMSQRPWGQLPGHLQTEFVQAAGGSLNSDYARLIQLYFREIADTQSATATPLRSPSAPNRQDGKPNLNP